MNQFVSLLNGKVKKRLNGFKRIIAGVERKIGCVPGDWTTGLTDDVWS